MIWILFYLILSSCAAQDTTAGQKMSLPIVELFTSEGCSSCPPADNVLKELVEKKSAICLSWHVDYWDRLGWKDPFSQAAFSARQRDYAGHFKNSSVYTPQMIVNGQNVFVGSNRNGLKAALSAKYADAPILLEGISLKNMGKITQITVDIGSKFAGMNLCLATCLASATTNVKRGENSGKTLNHVQVVTDFQQLTIGEASTYTFESNASGSDMNWIVFVQDAKNMHIVAAATVESRK